MKKSNLKRLLTNAVIAVSFVTAALLAFSADAPAKSPNGSIESARGALASHLCLPSSVGQNSISHASGLYAANQAANAEEADKQGRNQQSEKSRSDDDALFVSTKNDKDHPPDDDKGPCKHGKHKGNKHCVPSGKE